MDMGHELCKSFVVGAGEIAFPWTIQTQQKVSSALNREAVVLPENEEKSLMSGLLRMTLELK